MDYTTGRDLRVERVAAGLQVNVLAAEMRVSRTTLWTIERQAAVRPEQVAKVRDAIARLTQAAA